MEEPLAVKCEPELLSEIKEDPNIEPADEFVEMKIEPRDEEESQQHLIQEVNNAIKDEECDKSGNYLNEEQTLSRIAIVWISCNESQDGEVDQPQTCSVCKTPFSSSSIPETSKLHLDSDIPLCLSCIKAVNEDSYSKKQLLLNIAESSHSCTECHKVYSSQRSLRRHTLIHTGIKISCKICGKEISRGNAFKTHMNVHSGLRPYVCRICGKAYSNASSLRKHKVHHTQHKPYKCTTCGKDFLRGDTLLRHMKFHAGEKPYTCGVCTKSFTYMTSFNRHLMIHSGIRPLACSHCEKTFCDPSNLKKHLLIHTGALPYPCNVCGRAFRENGTRKKHMLRHMPAASVDIH